MTNNLPDPTIVKQETIPPRAPFRSRYDKFLDEATNLPPDEALKLIFPDTDSASKFATCIRARIRYRFPDGSALRAVQRLTAVFIYTNED